MRKPGKNSNEVGGGAILIHVPSPCSSLSIHNLVCTRVYLYKSSKPTWKVVLLLQLFVDANGGVRALSEINTE